MAGTSTINAAAPYNSGSNLAIQVTTVDGVSNTNITLTINSVPIVTSVSPGTVNPGGVFTISGYNFVGVTGVCVGGTCLSPGNGTTADTYTVAGPATINAAAPYAGGSGLAIQVTTANGVSIYQHHSDHQLCPRRNFGASRHGKPGGCVYHLWLQFRWRHWRLCGGHVPERWEWDHSWDLLSGGDFNN